MQQFELFESLEDSPNSTKVAVRKTAKVTVTLCDPAKSAQDNMNTCLRRCSEASVIITDPESSKLDIAEAERAYDLADREAINARKRYEALKDTCFVLKDTVELSIEEIKNCEEFTQLKISSFNTALVLFRL